MNELDNKTIQLLSSGQIITSLNSVVKELIENALDAGADSIEVALSNYGLIKIHVKDNGRGIPAEEMPSICKQYHTSKLNSFEDLLRLESFGFRGEALHAICFVSKYIQIATCCHESEIGEVYNFDRNGEITSSHPIAMVPGTTVTVNHIFDTLPVRRQIYSKNITKCKEEVKTISLLLQSFKIANHNLRFKLINDDSIVWQISQTSNLYSTLISLYGIDLLRHLQEFKLNENDEKLQIKVSGYVPNLDSEVKNITKSSNQFSIVTANRRPVNIPKIHTFLKNFYAKMFQFSSRLHPVYVLNLELPRDKIDVNLSTDKSSILIHNIDDIINIIKTNLSALYPPTENTTHSGKESSEQVMIDLADSDNTLNSQEYESQVVKRANNNNNNNNNNTEDKDDNLEIIPHYKLSYANNNNNHLKRSHDKSGSILSDDMDCSHANIDNFASQNDVEISFSQTTLLPNDPSHIQRSVVNKNNNLKSHTSNEKSANEKSANSKKRRKIDSADSQNNLIAENCNSKKIIKLNLPKINEYKQLLQIIGHSSKPYQFDTNSNSSKNAESHNAFSIIGYFGNGKYFSFKNINTLYIANTQLAIECSIYIRYLSEFCLKSDFLGNKIELTNSDLSEKHVNFLLNLPAEFDTKSSNYSITHPLLIQNGLEVQFSKSNVSATIFEITRVHCYISREVVPTLIDLIDKCLVTQIEFSTPEVSNLISKSRPELVKRFLRTEARLQASKNSLPNTKEELLSLVQSLWDTDLHGVVWYQQTTNINAMYSLNPCIN